MTQETLKTDGARLTLFWEGPEWDARPTATLGDIAFKSHEAGADVLTQAVEKVKDAGLTRVIGPMAGDTWHSYRFVSESDGSPAFLMEPKEMPQARAVFHAAGFSPVGQYFSARQSLAEIGAPPPESEGFRIETWDGSDPEGLFRQVFELSCQAFEKNAFYKAIPAEDFLAMYMPIVPMLKKELIFFARTPEGELAGFLFAIPDYAQGPQSDTVILKTYASLVRGAGRALVHACQSSAKALGYKTLIHALIHDANQSAERSEKEGGKIFRRYDLLGLKLDD